MCSVAYWIEGGGLRLVICACYSWKLALKIGLDDSFVSVANTCLRYIKGCKNTSTNGYVIVWGVGGAQVKPVNMVEGQVAIICSVSPRHVALCLRRRLADRKKVSLAISHFPRVSALRSFG